MTRETVEVILTELQRLRIRAIEYGNPAIVSWLEGAIAEAQTLLGRTSPAGTRRGPTGAKGLLEAEQALLSAERRVARQRQVVDEIAKDGHDTAMAAAILATYVDVLLVRRALLSRFQAELLGRRRWHPIDSAPEGVPVEVAVIGLLGVQPLDFACRHERGRWLNVESGEPLESDPTHWRLWEDRVG